MNQSTEQKPGQNDQKIEPEKVVAPGAGNQSPAKPGSKQDPKIAPSATPLKTDAGVKPAQK